jgi:ADP-ribose pyrophosphatase
MTREVVYSGKRIQVAVDMFAVPDGTTGRREVVLHPGAVAILALPDAGHVCLLRNRRRSVGQTLLEIPAGTLEPPEAPEAAAVRELKEETGFRAGRWRRLAEFYPSPGILNERMVLFVAEELTPGAMQLQADEELAPLIVAWDDALAWAEDGTIRDAKTLVALLLWDRERLRRRAPRPPDGEGINEQATLPRADPAG